MSIIRVWKIGSLAQPASYEDMAEFEASLRKALKENPESQSIDIVTHNAVECLVVHRCDLYDVTIDKVDNADRIYENGNN